MKIDFPVNQTAGISSGIQNSNTEKSNGKSFLDFLNGALGQVNDLQLQSQQLNQAFAAGQTDNIQDVMIASEKADLALQFTLQVRNKIMDAYQEIMRMPV